MEAYVLNGGILTFFAALLSGVIGAMGLGGGSILILYLTVFAGVNQVTAGGINLIFFLPIGIIAVTVYSVQKQIKYKTVLPYIAGGVPAAFLSGYILNFANPDFLSKIFGGFVLIYGAMQILKKDNE